MVEITNLETAKAVQAFVDALDEHDDVQGVYHNAQFSDEIAAAL
jgi:transcriptional/translational regulatory protein YebC/TACO1